MLLICIYFFSEVRRNIRCSKTQFKQIGMGLAHTHKLFYFLDTQSLIHNHGNSENPWFLCSLRYLC